MRRREKRLVQRFVLLLVGTLLAMLIGGAIGVWLQPGTQMTTRKSRKALYVAPEVLTEKRLGELTRTNNSPEILESGDLCYYAALHHATGHRYELSLLFVDALEERFRDSPFARKTRALRLLIETASKEVNEEFLEEAAVAQAHLAVEALPLLVNLAANPSLRLSVLSASSLPWWPEFPGGKLTLASPNSEYAGWPVVYTEENLGRSPSSIRAAGRARGTKTLSSWASNISKHGQILRAYPCRALKSHLPEVVSILREHLDDPRLAGIPPVSPPHKPAPVGGRPFEPERVGHICYELLCEVAGIRFDEIEKPPSDGSPQKKGEIVSITPRILAYIDGWIAECLEMDQSVSILWHLNQVEIAPQVLHDYVLRVAGSEHSQDALVHVRKAFDPNDPPNAFLLAQAAVRLGDSSLIAHVVRHLTEGRSPHVSNAIRFVAKHGTPEEKSTVLTYLQGMPTPFPFDREFEWIQWLALYGDFDKVTGLIERLRAGDFNRLPIRYALVNFIAEQNRADGNQAIVEMCLNGLTGLSSPGGTFHMNDHPRLVHVYDLWSAYSDLVARDSFGEKQKIRFFYAFLEWPLYLGGKGMEVDGKKYIATRRICDRAAQWLVKLGLVPGTFDGDAPDPDRNRRIKAIREELLKKYPELAETKTATRPTGTPTELAHEEGIRPR